MLNPPPCKSKYKVDCEVEKLKRDNANFKRLLEREINFAHSLKLDNQKLRSKVETIKKFLSENQIEMLLKSRISHCTNEAIIKGLKFRFALSVHGYEFLRQRGYPLPSYSTLMRRIQYFQLNLGIFMGVLQLLQFMVNNMDAMDKFCILSYDEK